MKDITRATVLKILRTSEYPLKAFSQLVSLKGKKEQLKMAPKGKGKAKKQKTQKNDRQFKHKKKNYKTIATRKSRAKRTGVIRPPVKESRKRGRVSAANKVGKRMRKSNGKKTGKAPRNPRKSTQQNFLKNTSHNTANPRSHLPNSLVELYKDSQNY